MVRSGEVGGKKESMTPFASSRVLYTLRTDLEVCQTRNVDGDRIVLTKSRLTWLASSPFCELPPMYAEGVLNQSEVGEPLRVC